MADFGTNFAAIPHGRGVEIRSLSLECAKPSPTSRQAVGRLWKSAAQVLSGRRVEVRPLSLESTRLTNAAQVLSGRRMEVRSLPLESTRGTPAAQSSTVAGWKSARRRWESQGGRMGDNCRASPIGAQGGSPPAAPRGQRQGWTSRGRTSRQAPSAKCAAETEGFGGKVAEGNGEAAHKRPRRDVKRREEKPRRERRRVGSRSLGGRRGTNANRNNATDGQTPEKKL